MNDEHAYALEISGGSMKPAYRNGDVIIVSPGATGWKARSVVVKTKDGEVMVKELDAQTAKSVELKSTQSPSTAIAHWPCPTQGALLARIVWASQ